MSSALGRDRRFAGFLVVFCSLCCLWIFQGGGHLRQANDLRQQRLEKLWEVRRDLKLHPRSPEDGHLRSLDNLFRGYRVVVRHREAGPLLYLEPTGDRER